MEITVDEQKILEREFFDVVRKELERAEVQELLPGEFTLAQCKTKLGYGSNEGARRRLNDLVKKEILKVRILRHNTYAYSLNTQK